MKAIKQYAEGSNESISELVKKVMIQEITYMKYSMDYGQYNYEIIIRHYFSYEKSEEYMQEIYNKSRSILGLDEIYLD